MTDPNRSVADELEDVEWELARAKFRHFSDEAKMLEERAAALRYDFALLAYAGRKTMTASPEMTVEQALKQTNKIALAFLRHFNPCDMPEDKSQQWQALYDQVMTFNARALAALPQPAGAEVTRGTSIEFPKLKPDQAEYLRKIQEHAAEGYDPNEMVGGPSKQPAGERAERREEIAKIIDEWAWRIATSDDQDPKPTEMLTRWDDALRKADAILSLPPPPSEHTEQKGSKP